VRIPSELASKLDKLPFSFTPGFSPVTNGAKRCVEPFQRFCLLNTERLSLKKLSDHQAEKNRFNGFLIIDGLGGTGLKPGVNEMCRIRFLRQGHFEHQTQN
jgi:hypothetical protein